MEQILDEDEKLLVFSNNLKQIELRVVSQILYSYMVSIYI